MIPTIGLGIYWGFFCLPIFPEGTKFLLEGFFF